MTQKRSRICIEAEVNPQITLSPDGTQNWMKLPVEMLTEIYSYLASPDILALTRTNLFFFRMLVKNELFLYIWKEARQRFHPSPIPNPLFGSTEFSLIAFLFDPSPCSNCGRLTSSLHLTYSLRAKACSPGCRKSWANAKLMHTPSPVAPAELAIVHAIQSWLPYYESDSMYYEKDTWTAEVARYQESLADPVSHAELKQSYARKAVLFPEIMKYSFLLRKWASSYQIWIDHCHRENRDRLNLLRHSNAWDECIFKDTPLYSELLSKKKLTHELFYPGGELGQRHLKPSEHLLELQRFESEFRAQVLALSKKRINASISETIRLNQLSLRKYWNTLKSEGDSPLLSYPEFRKLSMAKVLQGVNTDESGTLEFARTMSRAKQKTKAVQKELKKNEATRSHLHREMHAVLNTKRAQLAQKLGYGHDDCIVMSVGLVHPSERITSWFICTRCVQPSYPMEFHEIAEHRCRGLARKQNRIAWNVDWFQPAPKAINAGKELLRVLSASESTFRCTDLLEVDSYFLCKSCTVPIVLWADYTLFHHSQRHDSLTLKAISEEEAQKYMCVSLDEARDVTYNVHKFTKYATRLRQQKIYGCRHCETKDNLSVFTYDGLQSHLKAKHKLAFPANEDIKYVPHAAGPSNATVPSVAVTNANIVIQPID